MVHVYSPKWVQGHLWLSTRPYLKMVGVKGEHTQVGLKLTKVLGEILSLLVNNFMIPNKNPKYSQSSNSIARTSVTSNECGY